MKISEMVPDNTVLPVRLPLINRTHQQIVLDDGSVLDSGQSISIEVSKDRLPGLVLQGSIKLPWVSMGCRAVSSKEGTS